MVPKLGREVDKIILVRRGLEWGRNEFIYGNPWVIRTIIPGDFVFDNT